MKTKTGTKTLEIMSTATWYNNWLMEQISKDLRGDILEVGAGIGNFTKKLSMYGTVTAIDYDNNYKNANFGDIEKGKYLFKNKLFDTIVCMNVLEHIKDHARALGNMHSLLRSRGKLILLVPAHMSAYGPLDEKLGHFRRYSKHEVTNLLISNHYSLTSCRYINWLGLIGWIVNAKILGKEIIPAGQLKIFDKVAKLFLGIEKFISPPFGLSVLVVAQKI